MNTLRVVGFIIAAGVSIAAEAKSGKELQYLIEDITDTGPLYVGEAAACGVVTAAATREEVRQLLALAITADSVKAAMRHYDMKCTMSGCNDISETGPGPYCKQTQMKLALDRFTAEKMKLTGYIMKQAQ